MGDRKFIEPRFLDTYYFTNLVHNIVAQPTDYLLGLEGFFGDDHAERFLPTFPRWSRLHEFIEFLVSDVWYEEIDDVMLDAIVQSPSRRLWVERALDEHSIEYASLDSWLSSAGRTRSALESEDDLLEYLNHLYDTGPLDELLRRTTEEVFFILFGNREFLRRFNEMAASRVHEIARESVSAANAPLLKRDGVLQRRAIPTWVRKAAFFRERGLCALCRRDISGVVSIQSQTHFDHIVPLSVGGINDVTNIQLLCEDCNRKKSDRSSDTSRLYESWY